MTNSVIACHEHMDHINKKKGRLQLMAVKIDLAKTYDKVEQGVFRAILHLIEFPAKFIELIMTCISSYSSSFLINGSPFGMFRSSRGLRKGDPFSPALFTISIDLLSRILCSAEVSRGIHDVKICRRAPSITHLLYDDDSMSVVGI